MRKICENKLMSLFLCAIISITMLLSTITPIPAFAREKWIEWQEGSLEQQNIDSREMITAALVEIDPIAETTAPISDVTKKLEQQTFIGAEKDSISGSSDSQKFVFDFSEQKDYYFADKEQDTLNFIDEELAYALELINAYEYYSQLSAEQREALCSSLNVNNDALVKLENNGYKLAESILYGQVEYQFGFSIDSIIQNCSSQEDCMQLNTEMSKYIQSVGKNLDGDNRDQEFRQYILKGFTLEQVESVYGISRSLDIDMDSLLTDNSAVIVEQPNLFSKADLSQLEKFASELGINEQALMKHADQNELSIDELEAQIENSSTYIRELYQPNSQQQAAAAAASTGTLSLQSIKEVPANQIFAPFTYNYEDSEAISLNTGALNQQIIDATLPGRNGLDLVIARRYNSAEANLYNPGCAIEGNYTYESNDALSITAGIVEFGWKAYYLKNGVRTALPEYDMGPLYQLCPDTYNYNYNPFYRTPDYNWAQDFMKNNLGPNEQQFSFDSSGGIIVFSLYKQYMEFCAPGKAVTYFAKALGSGGKTVPNAKFEVGNYWVVYPTRTENQYNNKLYGLGSGWSFAFSSVETIDKTSYLHLNDGRAFQIDITTTAGDSNLKDYTLTDLRLEKENGGYSGATYTLYYKDGKKEHFDSQGRLIAIRDRFENIIRFVHTTENGLPKITITDTLGRVTTISGQTNASGHIMSVLLPDPTPSTPTPVANRTLTYTVNTINSNYNLNMVSFKALAAFKNQMSQTTTYTYDVNRTKFSPYQQIGRWSDAENYDVKSINTVDPICSEVLFLEAYDNYYLNLKNITYPTNSQTVYSYSKQIENMGSQGAQNIYRIASRYDIISGVTHNRKDYNFPQYTGSGPAGPTAYPAYGSSLGNLDPKALPSNYTYTGTITESASGLSVTTQFNNNHLPSVIATKNNSGYYVAAERFEYNTDKLPTKVTKKSYNQFSPSTYNPLTSQGSEPASVAAIEAYQYDKKGNITASWSPLANGNTANTEYKTTYTYDSTYSLPLTKTYKQDAGTTVLERNTVSGLNIIRQEMLVNSVVKSKTEYDYDSYGNITVSRRYKDGLSTYVQTNYAYQNNAYLSEVKDTGITNADGSLATGTPGYVAGTIVTKCEYDNTGRQTKVINANNQTTSYTYNALGHITRQTNPDNTTVDYERNYTQNTLTVKDENGTRLRYEYTQAGLEYQVVDVQSGTVLSRKTYDNLSRLLTEADLLNAATTTYAYDYYSRPTSKITRNSGNTILAQETYAYNEVYGSGPFLRIQKTVLGETNAPSIVTTQYLNNLGLVAQEGKLLGSAENIDYYTYDYIGNKTQERLAYAVPKGLTYSSKWEYDYAARVTRAYNADGNYTTNTYNALGQLASSTDYAGTATAYTYDGKDRLLEEKGIAEGTAYNTFKRYDYDPAGNITSTRISNNPVGAATTWARTEHAYNNRNRLEYVTLYDGAAVDNVTKYTYDGVGNTLSMRTGMSSKTSSDGQLTSYTYDRLNRILTLTDPLNQKETYTYKNSGLGLLNTKTDRNGNVNTYSYDALGRVLTLQVKTPDNVTETNSYTYMLTGAKKTEANATVSTSYIYDSLGRLTRETESGGVNAVKNYGYDTANNRTSFTATAGGVSVHNTTYTYDNQNRLKTVSDNGSLKATYNYNANGARDSLIYSNGTSEYYTYNKANWLTRMENRSGSSVASAYDYTYFADGNQRTKTDHTGRVTTYAYDGTGRLKTESENTGFGASYVYDRFGNRTQMAITGSEPYTVAYSYDVNNRLTQDVKTAGDIITTSKYHYDPNGNQLSKVSEMLTPATPAYAQVGIDPMDVELYEYDGFNRMTRSLVGEVEAGYTYRADGLRNSKETVDGNITHLWDGTNIAADLNGNAVTARYVRGINLLMSDSSEGQKFYLYNSHGDVVQLASVIGVILWQYDYDAFGNEREIAGQDSSLDTNPFRYCAEYFDKETGSIFLRARYYSPVLGRFRTEDPIRDGLNWYIYAGDNPLYYVDPFGLAIVALRAWYDDMMNYVSTSYNGTGSISWNASSRTATLMMAANGYSGNAAFIDGVNGAYVGKDGRMYVDDKLLWKSFGNVIDPPLKKDSAGTAIIFGASLGIAAGGHAAVGAIAASPTAATIAGTGAITASQAAQRALQGISNYTVKSYHLMSGSGSYSKFATDSLATANQWVTRGLEMATKFTVNSPDSYYTIVNMGQAIGTKGEQYIKIVFTVGGKIITAFPVK